MNKSNFLSELARRGINCSIDQVNLLWEFMHHVLETNIDRYLIKAREKKDPKKYKHYKYILNNINYSNELKEVIGFTFKETYGISNFNKILILYCIYDE